MRTRGLLFVIAAVPAWIFVYRFFSWAWRSPFGYELGSVAFHVPPFVRGAEWFAVLFTLAGLCLVGFDFFQWIRRKIA
jgi:hypothetical protein